VYTDTISPGAVPAEKSVPEKGHIGGDVNAVNEVNTKNAVNETNTKSANTREAESMPKRYALIPRGPTISLMDIVVATGASYSTVCSYAQKAGWTRRGAKTRLNETQTAAIIEAMKVSRGQGQNQTIQDNLECLETPLAPIARVKKAVDNCADMSRDEKMFTAFSLYGEVIAELKTDNAEKAARIETLETESAAKDAVIKVKDTHIENLEVTVGESLHYASTMEVRALLKLKYEPEWRPLKAYSKAHNIPQSAKRGLRAAALMGR
jgi:hypothetical protein